MDAEGTAYPPDLAAATWRTSSRSGGGENCVEVAEVPAGMAVRDSRDRLGAAFVFGAASWSAFVAAIRTGNLA